jgi:hypothetical protein
MQCCKSTDELKGNCPATISVVNVSQLLVDFAEQQRVCGNLRFPKIPNDAKICG